jgi:hypothetical protein
MGKPSDFTTSTYTSLVNSTALRISLQTLSQGLVQNFGPLISNLRAGSIFKRSNSYSKWRNPSRVYFTAIGVRQRIRLKGAGLRRPCASLHLPSTVYRLLSLCPCLTLPADVYRMGNTVVKQKSAHISNSAMCAPPAAPFLILPASQILNMEFQIRSLATRRANRACKASRGSARLSDKPQPSRTRLRY